MANRFNSFVPFAASSSLGASFTGSAIDTSKQGDHLSIVFETGGSNPLGILKLQGSNDGTIWADVPAGQQHVTASVSGSTQAPNSRGLVSVSPVTCQYVRAAFIRTSGSGSITGHGVVSEQSYR